MEEDLIKALNELLGAERAGAEVAARTARELDDGTYYDLMLAMNEAETRCIAMLSAAVETAGGMPAEEIGAFYEKAMNIDDHGQRLHFIHRGQDWIVRKLDALMPAIEDLALLGDLDDMRMARVALIEKIDALIDERGA